jgi:hypothetical protein
MGRHDLEHAGRELEPKDKTGEIIQCYALPVKSLLEQEFPILPEGSRVRAQRLSCRTNAIQILQITNNGFNQLTIFINDNVSLLGILRFYLNNTHILLHITSFSASFFSFSILSLLNQIYQDNASLRNRKKQQGILYLPYCLYSKGIEIS